MNVRGLIVDVSSNNHPSNAPISWHLAKQAGVVGAVIKATQMDKHGTPYENPWFQRDLVGALSAGIPAIAYHYASIADHSTGYSPEHEAKFFIEKAGVHFARVVDVETAHDIRWVNAFLAQLEGDGTEKAVYGSQDATDPQLVNGKNTPPFAQRWVAAYPGPVRDCVMHQYTDQGRVPGIIGNVDLSKWLGSKKEFVALFGQKPPNQIVNIIRPVKKLGK